MTHHVFALDQASFRGRNDDGNETTATWIDVANNNWSQALDTNFRVRFLVQESGAGTASGTLDAQLQYDINGGGWNNVTTSSTNVRAVAATPTSLDGTATTQQVGSGTFVAGEISEDGLAAQVSLSGDDETEVEFVLQLRSADLSGGETVNLRITDASTTPSWTNSPAITATSGSQNIDPGTIASGNTVYDPSFTGEYRLALPFLAAGSTLYDPSVSTPLLVFDEALLREPALALPGHKPQGPVKIDWRHPMTRGLQAAFIFSQYNRIRGDDVTVDLTGNGHDIIWVTVPTIGSYNNDTNNEKHVAGVKSLNASQHYGYIAAGNLPAQGAGIYAFAWSGIGEDAGTAIASIYGPTGGSTDLQLWHGSAGYQLQPYNCADAPNETVAYITDILDRRIACAYWNDTVNNEQGFYTLKNGAHQALTDTLTSDALPSDRKFLFLTDADSLGTDGDGSLGNWYQGVLEYFFVWDRKLTEAEGVSINIDPYQFIVPA